MGGGPDIDRSLLLGASSITAVDINSALLDVMTSKYSEFTGNLFTRPTVNLKHSEGRSFLQQSKSKYDLIQLTGVDTFSALSGGAYVLAENYIYTTDALREYYNHLSDDGIICIHRWFFDKPRESLRLFAIALEALKLEGVQNPEQHVAVVKAGTGITFIKKKPFTNKELKNIETEIQNRVRVPDTVNNQAIYRSSEAPKFPPGIPELIYPLVDDTKSNIATKVYANFVKEFKKNNLKHFYDQ